MIKPQMYRILVQLSEVKNQTASGILTMTQKQEQREFMGNIHGTIVDIGPTAFKGEEFGGVTPKVGDRVLFARYSGEYMQYPADAGEHYRIMNDTDVIAVLEGEENADTHA